MNSNTLERAHQVVVELLQYLMSRFATQLGNMPGNEIANQLFFDPDFSQEEILDWYVKFRVPITVAQMLNDACAAQHDRVCAKQKPDHKCNFIFETEHFFMNSVCEDGLKLLSVLWRNGEYSAWITHEEGCEQCRLATANHLLTELVYLLQPLQADFAEKLTEKIRKVVRSQRKSPNQPVSGTESNPLGFTPEDLRWFLSRRALFLM